jgi:hypothetical protein
MTHTKEPKISYGYCASLNKEMHFVLLEAYVKLEQRNAELIGIIKKLEFYSAHSPRCKYEHKNSVCKCGLSELLLKVTP